LLLLEDGIEGNSHLIIVLFEIDKKNINELLELEHLMDYAEDKQMFLTHLMTSSTKIQELAKDNNKGFASVEMSCINKYSGLKKFN